MTKKNGSIQESVVGIDFDVDLAQSIYDEADEGETVSVPLTIIEPGITSEELKRSFVPGCSGGKVHQHELQFKQSNQ